MIRGNKRSRGLSILVMTALAFLLSPILVSTVDVAPAHAAGPCRVTGYSLHARYQMAVRDISKAEVQDSVATFCSSGVHQANGNWLYRSTSAFLPTVVLSSGGTVVTTWWEGDGGGGGGGGGW